MLRFKLSVVLNLFCVFIFAQSKNDSLNYVSSDSLPSISVVKADVNARLFPELSKKELGYSILTAQLFDLSMAVSLFLMPENISKWDSNVKYQMSSIMTQYKSSFTKPPVFDQDLFMINYVGHPYQGAFYYNTLRSRGGSMLHSTLFNLTNTVFWEYIWEGGMEQPSIQDLIVTPVIGSVLGELAHRATLKFKQKGYFWYEKVLVTIINPSYVISNGYK